MYTRTSMNIYNKSVRALKYRAKPTVRAANARATGACLENMLYARNLLRQPCQGEKSYKRDFCMSNRYADKQTVRANDMELPRETSYSTWKLSRRVQFTSRISKSTEHFLLPLFPTRRNRKESSGFFRRSRQFGDYARETRGFI